MSRRQFIEASGLALLAGATMPSINAAEPEPASVAFVGLAHIHTPGYIDLLKSRPDFKIKSVWDPDRALSEKYTHQTAAQAAKTLDEIWADPAIKAVIICSETNRHRDLVLAAAKAGKHMFVEKPLGITGQESLEMAAAIDKADLLFNTGYFMRSDPKHLFLRDQIQKGNFGTISRVRGSNCHAGSLNGWFDKEYRWMADPKIAGVGAFGDLGTHKLDILMWFFGPVDSVTGDIRPVTGRYGDCDETGEAIIQFHSGVIGTLAAGWVDIEDPVQLLISGTEGHAVIVDNHLYYKSKKIPRSESKDPYTDLPKALRPPMHQFLDAVAGAKDQALVTPKQAAARVMVMEAIYKAAKEKTWVKVT